MSVLWISLSALVPDFRNRAIRVTFTEPPAANGVDLVHKNDAGLVLLGIGEHFADDSGRLADVLVHDGRGHDLQELGLHVAGQRASD